jgi:hypothetical protein
MQIDKIISFNTGRQYSDQGQRIAAAVHNGIVIMVDVDRGIDYALPGAALERNSIIDAYDNPALHTWINTRELFNGDYKLQREFLKELEDHALLASPGCILPK